MKQRWAALGALGIGLAAAPAGAVLIASGDGTGNTTPPADDPGFTHAAIVSTHSAVYLGDGWVLTANHVATGPVTILGVVHAPVPGTDVRLLHAPGVWTDLRLFRIVSDPGLDTLEIAASTPPVNAQVTMAGHGRDRGSATSWMGVSGWSWLPSKTLRWGVNRVTDASETVVLGGSTIQSMTLDFDASAPGHEAVGTNGDSGGPVFVGGASNGTLAGLIYAIYSYQNQPGSTSLFGNGTFAADLSYYRSAILSVAAERACSDGGDDDGDGLVDAADPGCLAADDAFETNVLAPCDDGFDSDADGLVDFPDDPGCRDSLWLYEDPKCEDDLDNDGDGGIDWDGGPGGGTPDPQCTSAWKNKEAAGCGLGFELALLAPVLARLRRLRRAG